jgi:hypothetical protein
MNAVQIEQKVAEAVALANWVALRDLRFRETDSIAGRRTK